MFTKGYAKKEVQAVLWRTARFEKTFQSPDENPCDMSMSLFAFSSNLLQVFLPENNGIPWGFWKNELKKSEGEQKVNPPLSTNINPSANKQEDVLFTFVYCLRRRASWIQSHFATETCWDFALFLDFDGFCRVLACARFGIGTWPNGAGFGRTTPAAHQRCVRTHRRVSRSAGWAPVAKYVGWPCPSHHHIIYLYIYIYNYIMYRYMMI